MRDDKGTNDQQCKKCGRLFNLHNGNNGYCYTCDAEDDTLMNLAIIIPVAISILEE